MVLPQTKRLALRKTMVPGAQAGRAGDPAHLPCGQGSSLPKAAGSNRRCPPPAPACEPRQALAPPCPAWSGLRRVDVPVTSELQTYFGGSCGVLPAPGRVMAPGAPGCTGSPSSWPHSGRLAGKGRPVCSLQQCKTPATPNKPSPESPEQDLFVSWGSSQRRISGGLRWIRDRLWPKVTEEMEGTGFNGLKGSYCVWCPGCVSNHSSTSLSPPTSQGHKICRVFTMQKSL